MTVTTETDTAEAATTRAIFDDRFGSAERFTTITGITKAAEQQLSASAWDYLWTGTGSETTVARNSAKFDELLWEVPLFAGVRNPDTSTSVLGFDLSLPLFTAPFGQEATFHPDGHLAVSRAAARTGVQQMVPVAASYRLEDVAAASDATSIFQMTLVGDEELVLEMMHRAKRAGYTHIVATYSPIRQWRERLIENRFSSRSTGDNVNFGEGASDPRGLQELIAFTEPRYTWADAARVIERAPLPVIVKGIHSAKDALAARDAGAVGLYVSNYGGRTIDRTLSTIEVLPEVRAAVGDEMPIILDSGIRRGSDIAAAVALGADAVAIGRLTALGLAADGEDGVARVIEILKQELWMTLGHLGCSSVDELGAHVFRENPFAV